MITLKFPIQLSEEDKQFVVNQQQIQSSMIRCAYKAAQSGLAEISVRKEVRDRFVKKLDSWYQQSAVKSGIGMFKADHELKVQSRIFGGKKNFIRRSKNLISNDEWKKLRLLPLYLIGEAQNYGNRKFVFEFDKIIFKPHLGKKIEIQLPELRKNWCKLWTQAVILSKQKLMPITVSLTANTLCLSLDDSVIKQHLVKKPISTRYAGVDMNPNYIGISVFDSDKLIATKLFSLKSLTGKHINENKLEHETREVGHQIGRWLQHLQVKNLFIEQLSFKNGNKGIGKNYNRLVQNQWKRSALTGVLKKYFKLYEINAAYTSTIGNVMNTNLPDPVAASVEVARRGYQVIIRKSKKFYPELPAITYLEDLWKETEIPVVSSWKELHDWIKKSGLKYRVPLPSIESFRFFSSLKSSVLVI